MRVYASNETTDRETRAALTPETAEKLVRAGFEVRFEPGMGARADFPDAAFEAVGAQAQAREKGLPEADVCLWVGPPPLESVSLMQSGALSAGFLDPFQRKDVLEGLANRGVQGVSLEMMPRSTLAQKMDAISSQANIAGYMAVIVAAERLNRIFPMMMTPAGTISPVKVFVIGIGVAGLQAIATAKRLGARVTAFDTRAEALEQAESLGAKPLRIDLGETGSTAQGYAKELTAEQLEQQRQAQAKVCADSDIVITTAKLFGRPAPRLVGADVVAGMGHGSIVVDLAAETGGNVEGVRVDQEVTTDNGVRLIGHAKLETFAPGASSSMYANNLTNFLLHFWDGDAKTLNLDPENELLKGCVVTRDGAIVHERFRGA